ncbi:hypothetical protein NDU88_000900 [Pleurodeles waltl]|uniref:Uncharacterized protein n=1 Tax=Pleurodeles waltl TaxID=8319 RepID=A0AAV7V700_PLEWA|nr:hypothetical protein NDU88_000900 [Pleurodeles waltl]
MQSATRQIVVSASAPTISSVALQTQLTDPRATISQVPVPTTKGCDQQEVCLQASLDNAVTMQINTKRMLSMILDEIRDLNTLKAIKVAVLHVRLAKMEKKMSLFLERLNECRN